MHTLSPGMMLRDGKPEFVYGTMGGDGQPQTHVQLIHGIYERGLPCNRRSTHRDSSTDAIANRRSPIA